MAMYVSSLDENPSVKSLITHQLGCIHGPETLQPTDIHPGTTRHLHTHTLRPEQRHPTALRIPPRPRTTTSSRRPQPRRARLPPTRRLGTHGPPRRTQRAPFARLVGRSLLRHRRLISFSSRGRRSMGPLRGSAEEPAYHGSSVTAQRRAEFGHKKRAFLGQLGGCGGHGV